MMGTVRVTAGEFPAARNKAAKVLCATTEYCTNCVISYSKLVRAGVSYSIVAAERLLGGGSLIPTADGMRPRCAYSTGTVHTPAAHALQ